MPTKEEITKEWLKERIHIWIDRQTHRRITEAKKKRSDRNIGETIKWMADELKLPLPEEDG